MIPPRVFAGILFVVVVAACVIAVIQVASTGDEVATAVLSIPVLVISAATLWQTTAKGAKLVVIRQDELELDDLIFYVYHEGGAGQVPRDYLLQLHVAVCNVGDRKAVLSRLALRGFLTEDRTAVDLPGAPAVIAAKQWRWQSGWIDGKQHYESIELPPPFVLDPGDVITLRFRCQRAIDWSAHNLEDLRRFCEPLQSPLVRAFGEITWRRGDRLSTDTFQLDIRTTQQEEYVESVIALTKDFTRLPTIPARFIELE